MPKAAWSASTASGSTRSPAVQGGHSSAQVARRPNRQNMPNKTRYGIARHLVGQRDGGQAAAVIALAAQTGAPVAEKQILLGGGVVRRLLDRGQAKPRQTLGDITRQIEQVMRGP